MDFVTLANQVIQALTPFMPLLGGVGGGIGTAMVKKAGEDIYDQGKEEAKHLYETIKTRIVEEKDGGKAMKALQNFTDDPEDYRDIFEKRLLLLLQNDQAFANQLHQLLQNSPQMRILATDESIVRKNKMINTLGSGSQEINAANKALVEENEMTIKYE